MGRRAGFTAESRFFWIRIQIFWKHLLPGLADSHVRETVSFPDLLIRMSGNLSASRTCSVACQRNGLLDGLADSLLRERESFEYFLTRLAVDAEDSQPY